MPRWNPDDFPSEFPSFNIIYKAYSRIRKNDEALHSPDSGKALFRVFLRKDEENARTPPLKYSFIGSQIAPPFYVPRKSDAFHSSPYSHEGYLYRGAKSLYSLAAITGAMVRAPQHPKDPNVGSLKNELNPIKNLMNLEKHDLMRIRNTF